MNNFIEPLGRYGSAGFRPEGMFVSDFDGTLRSSSGTIAERDLETLRELGRAGFLRVIATGRTLYSLNKAIDDSLPVDYIVFSSGAGVLDFQKKRIIRKMSLDAEGVRVATEF
ncbi:MAG TPA: HAD hydrolase family protein, partial [Spirochaetia bacterium]|nr:HAD hydrolase family protein [Spirochaetia bacterium]